MFLPTLPAGPSKRSLYGMPISNDDSQSDNTRPDPASTTVLIPLVISMILVLGGLGLAVYFFVRYKRRHRIWLVDFHARRRGERREFMEREKEEKGAGRPGMWEVEVEEVEDVEEDGEEERWSREYKSPREDSDDGWTPVAVTYRREISTPIDSPLSSAPNENDSTKHDRPSSREIAVVSALAPAPSSEPNSVEMTVLIAMPSPTHARSRRSSPTPSIPSLSSFSRSDSGWSTGSEDEIPEVQLATVVMPVHGRTGSA